MNEMILKALTMHLKEAGSRLSYKIVHWTHSNNQSHCLYGEHDGHDGRSIAAASIRPGYITFYDMLTYGRDINLDLNDPSLIPVLTKLFLDQEHRYPNG